LKRYATFALPALLLAAVLILPSCGGDGNDSSGGMDHDRMGHGPGGMVTENGRYSDERFIDAMVPHHQGAIAMAHVALENAEHEEMKQLSRNIISTQQAEIEQLKSIKEEEFGTSRVPMEMSPQQMRGMGMMDPQDLANQEPFDRAFIDAMIPHHRSAIEMAQIAAEKSTVPEIKELAKNIVSAQQREIEQMKQWQKEWYPQG
jgi:uncharacterized protein (DUF305 family)